jgi:type IV secretion system protein VirB1
MAFRHMAVSLAILLFASLPVAAGESRPPSSPENVKLSPAQFDSLARRCAPDVPPDIMRGIARTESAFYPYVLSINYPETSAQRRGYDGKVLLLRQPRGKSEAIHWAKWYLARGYTVSVGLVQVNVEMAPRLKVPPMALFDPCINLAAGAKIFLSAYATVPHTQDGLLAAFSLYNSGTNYVGITNGYASTVFQNTLK